MAGGLTISTLNDSSGVLATQNGMRGIAKAWAQWNPSTSTLNNSFNVSSMTKYGTGQWGFTFTTAMPNANYAIAGIAARPNITGGHQPRLVDLDGANLPTTTICRVITDYASGTGGYDPIANASIIVIGT